MKDIDHSETSEDRLNRLGIELPGLAPSPIGTFCNVRRTGNLLYVSGQGPVTKDRTLFTGKVGGDVTSEDARAHAELVALNILAALRETLGTLNSVTGIIKLLGLVNATPEFSEHPFVIDGASELLASVFGTDGIHARSAFGVTSLPNQITVEIEGIFEVAS